MDSRNYKPKFTNHNYNIRNGFNQPRKRRPNYEQSNSRSDSQVDPISFDKWEKMVKDKIPKIIEQFYLASYKDIEEGLDKLNIPKNLYNYLDALDSLLQSKQIHMVHHKPDVFAVQPKVDEDKLERHLIYLQELKAKNTIKNAPKKNPTDKKSNQKLQHHQISSTSSASNASLAVKVSKLNNLARQSSEEKTISTTSSNASIVNLDPDSTFLSASSSLSSVLMQKKDDLNNEQIDQITSTDELKQNQEINGDENCKEESVKDLPQRIVISNMVASKTGDKQKAKRRKARRIRKATKNKEEKRSKLAAANEDNEDDGLISLDEENNEKQAQPTTTGPVKEKKPSKKAKAKQKKAKQKKNNEESEKVKNENLKHENSSQVSPDSDSEDNDDVEYLPDSEIFPSPDIYKKISDAGFDYESIITRFANWNRSPISALNEFGQICHISVKLDITDSNGPDHAKLFQATAFLDKKKLSIAWGKSKKRAKSCASELAIRAITASLPADRCDLDIQKYSDHYDQLAVLSYAKFNELLILVPNYVNFGRKIVATILMRKADDAYSQVIAVGTGNRCVSGEHLVTNGKVIFDSHAEVIARRSFVNFLIKQVEFHKTGEQESIFTTDESNESSLLVLKEGVTFHLYISTAPCGDGALFTHSSNPLANVETDSCSTESGSENHKPLYETFLHGRLRTKMEAGEGTISLDETYVSPELDQLLRGERLRTMSCSDKICRWNLLGLQGCLLLHFIKPIYLSSISLGSLFHSGHLARACCCRLEQTHFQEKLDETKGLFKINHPSLGCPSSFKFPREPVKTKSDSLNWASHEAIPELTNGNTGVKFNSEQSRICKSEIFKNFKALCSLYEKEELIDLTYYEVKSKLNSYIELKNVFIEYLKLKKYGPWVCKPLETKVFK